MVSAVAGSELFGAVTAAQNRAQVSREEFMKILVAELTSQNPLDPLDNGQFLDQLVGLQSLEQSAALTDSLRSFQGFMEMSSASALIGKVVKALGSDGNTVEGVVDKVVLEGGKALLVVGTQKVPVGSVREIY